MYFLSIIYFNREPTENASVPREKLGQLPEDAGLIRFSSHEDLQSRAQQIVDDINAKRKRDNDLLRSECFIIRLLD